MSLLIRAAARTLPAAIRGRYREQWLADARDATEAGLSPRSITLAALAFAITYDRPLPAPRVPTAEQRAQRSRLAVGLALSAALLGVSHFTSLFGSTGLTGNAVYDTAMQLLDTMIIAFTVLAPIVAVTIVLRTSEVATRVRMAVLLLVLPVLSPIGRIVIDSWPIVQDEIYYSLGGLAYLAGAIIVAVALRLLWTEVPRREPATWRTAALSAVAVFVIGGVGLAGAIALWVNRAPMVWSWQPGRATTMGDDGTLVQWDIFPTQADYEQWLSLNAMFESHVTVALTVVAALVVAAAAAVIVLTRRAGIAPLPLAVALIAAQLIVVPGLLWFMGYTRVELTIAPELLATIGRVLLVAVTLVSVGGVRYLPRVRHRHDVESGVELL